MRFIVEGKVQGKARARTFFNHNTGRMQSITPEQTKSYEELIRWSYKASGGKYLGEQPIELSVKAFYPVPQVFNKEKKQQAITNRIRPMTKPDTDNILKVVLDALNGVAYYDDKQVISIVCEKWYAERGYLLVELKEQQNER